MARSAAALAVFTSFLCAAGATRGLCAGEPEIARLAAACSRDTLLFVWTGDRAGLVRRASGTALARSLRDYDSEALATATRGALADLSLFLTPEQLSLFAWACGRGEGEIALAVEEIEGGDAGAEPQLLAIADKAGLEGPLRLLGLAARGDEDAREELDDLELPGAPAFDSARVVGRHRGSELIAIDAGDGRAVHFVDHGGLLFAASSRAALERAIDRAASPSFGSLRDSLRFRESWRELAPGRGAIVVYANLRRIRDSGGLLVAASGWARDFCQGPLAAFDGVALAARGAGERWSIAIDLERGSGRGTEPLLRENAPFGHAAQIGIGPAVLALRCEPSAAGDWIGRILHLAGGYRVDDVLEEVLDAIGGVPALDPLIAGLDDDVELFSPAGHQPGETQARIGMRIGVKDRAAVAGFLAQAVAKAGKSVAREGRYGATRFWLVVAGRFGQNVTPVVALHGDHLYVFTALGALRDAFGAVEAGRTFARDSRFLGAFDVLDVDPAAAGCMQAFFDVRALNDGTFFFSASTLMAQLQPSQRTARFVRQLLLALDDPDVQEGLSTIAVRAESRPSGVRIELIGP